MAGFVSVERLAYGPWQAFERMLARMLEHAGFKDVYVVGGSGDMGADIVGTLNGSRWVVQAKFRDSAGVDSSAAREVVRSISAYEASTAVAAASTYFTEDAYLYHDEVLLSGIELYLWAGNHLIEYWDELPEHSKQVRTPRDYQQSAIDAVESHRGNGRKSALIVMATGLGKSLVANQLIANELDRNREQEVLVLAHTNDLVKQLEASSWSQLKKHWSTHLWCDGEVPAYAGGVVFATWQSVFAAIKRGEDLDRKFGLVVVDEAHHSPSASYSQLLAELNPNMLVGLTATPWRGDDRSLKEIYGDPVYTMDVVQGMQRGFLAEVDYRMLVDGLDWEGIAERTKQGLTVKNLNELLILPDRDSAIVESIADEIEKVPDPRVLVFCKSIEHAERIQPMFAAFGIRAAVIHSKLDRVQRFKSLSSFRRGDIDVLISVEMLNEGIDVPEVNIIAFMRVTHSRRIFIQQLGRGLRVSGTKEKVVVLDFVADIRRIAAGVSLNSRATSIASDAKDREIIRFHEGEVVKFSDARAENFFDEYLADISGLEDLDESSRLKFPAR
ncbi:MAG: DEAD/DEAH box helicase family protein [Halieaceae bacterium]